MFYACCVHTVPGPGQEGEENETRHQNLVPTSPPPKPIGTRTGVREEEHTGEGRKQNRQSQTGGRTRTADTQTHSSTALEQTTQKGQRKTEKTSQQAQ